MKTILRNNMTTYKFFWNIGTIYLCEMVANILQFEAGDSRAFELFNKLRKAGLKSKHIEPLWEYWNSNRIKTAPDLELLIVKYGFLE